MPPLRILLVDDNHDDCFLAGYALRKSNVPLLLETVHDGMAALERLRGDASPLDLMLLDIQMPKLTGIEVLEELQRSPALPFPATAMLSASNNHHDICRCRDLGARDFLNKPLSSEMFVGLLVRLGLI